MKLRMAWLLLLALAAGGCSRTTKPAAGLMLIVSSELQAPSQFDAFEFELSQAAGTSWKLIENQTYLVPSEAKLPATIAIDPSPSGNQEVLIRVIALLAGAPVVLREVQTQVPTNRVAELRLVIGVLCEGDVTRVGAEGDVESKCASGESCQPATGSCGPNLVESRDPPPVRPGGRAAGRGYSQPVRRVVRQRLGRPRCHRGGRSGGRRSGRRQSRQRRRLRRRPGLRHQQLRHLRQRLPRARERRRRVHRRELQRQLQSGIHPLQRGVRRRRHRSRQLRQVRRRLPLHDAGDRVHRRLLRIRSRRSPPGGVTPAG